MYIYYVKRELLLASKSETEFEKKFQTRRENHSSRFENNLESFL